MTFHVTVKHFRVKFCGVRFSSVPRNIPVSWFWDELNPRVRRTGAILTILNQLLAKILYEWNNLHQNYVQCYVTSIRRHCLAVVKSAGDIPDTKFTWRWTPQHDLT